MKLKNIHNICKPYTNKKKSLKNRFFTPDQKSDRFIDKLNRVKNRSLMQDFLHPIELFQYSIVNKNMDRFANAIIKFIGVFTNHAEYRDEDIEKYKKYLIGRFPDIIDIEYTSRDVCDIILKDEDRITFKTITSAIDGSETSFPDLLTGERQGKCHGRSLLFTTMLDTSSLNKDVQVSCVTGVVWDLLPETHYMHSWVEMEVGDDTYCLDNNFNVLMKKDDYYRLQHPQVLQRIDSNTVIHDWEKIKILNARSSDDTPYLKLYCASRDEALETYEELRKEAYEEIRNK